MSWFSALLNTCLASLVLGSCVNFFAAFTYLNKDVMFAVNSWLLVISGLLINAGTMIQIVGNLVTRSNILSFNYLTCLVSGCFMLFFGQLFTCIHKNITDWDFLISMAGSLLSFVFTLTLLVINKINAYRDLKSLKKYAVANGELSPLSKKLLVYYEGTSGVGKTTRATSNTYDYLFYLDKHPEFAEKSTIPYIQTLYNMQLYSDITRDIVEFSGNNYKQESINDRFIFSQLAYDIIFQYDGQRTHPDQFKARVDAAIFSRPNLVRLIRASMRKVVEAALDVAPNTVIKIVWFIASNPEFTKQKILERNSFEAHEQDWDLVWYIKNQNYIFTKLHTISGIGAINNVTLIKTHV